MTRVWKGILGIRDLTKIRCGIRENEKYLDGIRDLTATKEAGFTKIWVRDAGFCCLSVGNSGKSSRPKKTVIAAKANQPGERKISIERANLLLKFISFCRNESFYCIFGKEETTFGIAMKKVRDVGFS